MLETSEAAVASLPLLNKLITTTPVILLHTLASSLVSSIVSLTEVPSNVHPALLKVSWNASLRLSFAISEIICKIYFLTFKIVSEPYSRSNQEDLPALGEMMSDLSDNLNQVGLLCSWWPNDQDFLNIGGQRPWILCALDGQGVPTPNNNWHFISQTQRCNSAWTTPAH